MKHTFSKLNLPYRLFLLIIILFLIPYLALFSWSYKKAENIIKDKAQTLEMENLDQVSNEINNLCLNIAKASDYLVAIDSYTTLYNESFTKGYPYLKCYKSIDTLVQNVNNHLLDSRGDISVLSEDQLLYSTLPVQKFRYKEFFKEQIPNPLYFSNAHNSYYNFEKDETHISYIRELPSFCEKSFYLVISVPTKNFSQCLNTATGSMQLLDTSGKTICKTANANIDGNFRTEIEIPVSNWKLVNILSADSIYKDIYQLRFFTFVISFLLLLICMLVTFKAIYVQLKPLLKLKEQMELVTLGNLNAKVATSDSKDEISSLSRAFNTMVNEISNLIEEIQVTQKRESELRFEMLLAQINPHFLFNTLNSIKWMSVVARTDNITSTITALGRLLEISMNKVNDVLTIEEELTNIKSYIQIQTMRYPGRFEVNYQINEEILSSYTLKLLLQPLVENAILHNIEQREYLIIEITGQTIGDNISLCVKDNGIGMTKEMMQEILLKNTTTGKGYVFSGIGVCNVQERIQLAYGSTYGLQYHSDGSSFTEAAITFPNHKSPN